MMEASNSSVAPMLVPIYDLSFVHSMPHMAAKTCGSCVMPEVVISEDDGEAQLFLNKDATRLLNHMITKHMNRAKNVAQKVCSRVGGTFVRRLHMKLIDLSSTSS
jgi:hypothetical protein